MKDLQNYLDTAFSQLKLKSTAPDIAHVEYDIDQEISDMIISLRNEKGLTQGQLASLAKISQANISKFENKNSQPSLATLKKIADACGKRLVVSFADMEDEQ